MLLRRLCALWLSCYSYRQYLEWTLLHLAPEVCWVGANWEGFVIEQLINHLKFSDRVVTPYYLRTSDQHEIGVLLDFGRTLWAIEVTLTSSPDSDTARRLNKTADLVSADRRIIVSRTEETVTTDAFVSTNLTGMLELLRTLSAASLFHVGML